MPNQVTLKPEGYIELSFAGRQSARTVQEIIEKSLELNAKLESLGRRVLVLIDITELAEPGQSALRAGLSGLKNIQFDSAAIYGARNKFMTTIIESLIALSGRSRGVRYFDTRDEALAWLLRA